VTKIAKGIGMYSRV